MTSVASDPRARWAGFAGTLRGEWIKLVTLRAYAAASGAVVAGLAGMGILPALAARADVGPATAVAVQYVLASMSWLQLLVAVPAVVFFAGEYPSGAATVTFLAVPARVPVLLAKQLALAGPAAAAGAGGAALAHLGTALLVGTPPAAWTTLQSVGGAALYLAAIAALSTAVAAIVRDPVGGTLTVAVLLTVAPVLVSLVPIDAVRRVAAWLPTPAGQLVYLPEVPEAVLPWWGGGLVLLAWTIGATVVAGALLRIRDV